MRKMMKLLPAVLMALFMVSVTSCVEDDDYRFDDDSQAALREMVQTLRGHWTGKTAARFRDSAGLLREEVYDTDVEFDLYDSNSRNGRGRQVDYFNGKVAYDRTFSWTIDPRSANIIITYDGENGRKFQMVIDYDDMKLDDHAFSGVMVGGGETDEFSYARYTYAKKAAVDFEE